MKPRITRTAAPAAAALLLITSLGVLTERRDADPGDVTQLGTRLSFRESTLNTTPPGGRILRPVAPDLHHIRSWISAVGAAVALLDADGNGRADDACLVDPRDDSVRVFPVPGTGERYAPITLAAPDPEPIAAPMGCVPADLDVDGDQDVLVYYWGRSPVQFLRVGKGYHGHELITPRQVWNTTALAVADVDGDRQLDVLAGNYFPDGARVLDPGARTDERMRMHAGMGGARNGGTNRLLLSRPAGTDAAPRWTDASTALPGEVARAWTLAIGMQDLTGDLLPEIYLGNDFGPDDLLVNLSTPGRPELRAVRGARDLLTPKSKVLGHDSFKGMGVAFTYPDGAELPSIMVSNITTEWGLQESNLFFVPDGEGRELLAGRVPYADDSEAAGLSRSGWAWDVKAVDYDADGTDELIQATGFVKGRQWRWPELQELAMGNDQVLEYPVAWPKFRPGDDISGHQHNPLWIRGAEGRYIDVAPAIGLDRLDLSRGLAVGDVDGDGRPDTLVANQWEDSRLLLNQSRGAHPHTTVHLVRPAGTALTPAVGATITLRPPGGAARRAQLYPSNGHAGVSSAELFLGSGTGAASEATVSWLTGAGPRTATVALTPGAHTLVLHDDGRIGQR